MPIIPALLEQMITASLQAFADAQALYLFGSFGTADEWPESDVDIAILLPPSSAKKAGFLSLHPLRAQLASLVGREVDLVNLRLLNTVFQKEIVMADRRICCADPYAADEFEMLVLSYYQRLNEERAGILQAFAASGRAYPV
ncbi:MAG: nucleotidyltransferase domain-containing protein [Candidatus Latescibacterota bacterium]